MLWVSLSSAVMPELFAMPAGRAISWIATSMS